MESFWEMCTCSFALPDALPDALLFWNFAVFVMHLLTTFPSPESDAFIETRMIHLIRL